MAIEWLAGNRLRGTTAERPNFGLPSGSVGGWVEVARTTLGSNSTSFTVSSIPDKRYYFVLINPSFTNAGSGNSFRLGSGGTEDGGSNYAYRRSTNGGSDVTGINQSSGIIPIGGYSTEHELLTMHIANKSDKEKLCIHNRCYSIAGAGNAPLRIEQTSKWTNTSNAIDMMKATLNSSGGFASGTEIVVLGYDPADTHTTNFWEELATHTQSSSGEATISFTSKKYLMIQYEITTLNPTATGLAIRFNSDSGSNYARRFSQEGGSDSTNTSQDKLSMIHSGGSNFFANMFIINNASNEKLIIAHQVAKTSASDDETDAPRRWEITGKWTNTSDQISSLTFIDTEQGSSGISKGNIKVWGSN